MAYMASHKAATGTQTRPEKKTTATKTAKKPEAKTPAEKAGNAKKANRTMSAGHKEAITVGRNQSQAVRNYLEALEQSKPARGRKRTPDSVQAQLDDVRNQLTTATAEAKLVLLQRELDLVQELGRFGTKIDIAPLEVAFIEVADDYSQRKGISYTAWRAVGVDPTVLVKAGIARTRSTTKTS
jgi:hypothetical protein